MQVFSALRRLGIVIAIAVAFLFGLAGTVYLSLLSPEVKVPEVIGKDRFEAEKVLGEAGLNYRVRATRPSNQASPNTVMFQLPRAGEVVKVGQTVALDVSRAAKEGERSEAETTDEKAAEERAVENRNTAPEEKPRRTRPVNRNANENANANANANRNTNSAAVNRNVNRLDSSSNRKEDAGEEKVNANRSRVGSESNQNSSRRPMPRPSATRNPDR
ncbi:MAG TPA: PASTA domain-containing protein [Pyrinomonadaceae bacterium]|nr:PASTA domain-containing protein [Pyrinomonadaceae bacterium]